MSDETLSLSWWPPVHARAAMAAPTVAALLYPASVVGVYLSGRLAHAHPGMPASLALAALLIAVFSVPLYGLAEALRFGRIEAPTVGEHRLRWLAHLVVATPPLFGAFGVIFSLLQKPFADYAAWAVIWAGLVAYAYRQAGDNRPFVPAAVPVVRLRAIHGSMPRR
jgi:hypothetical protein